MGAPNFLGAPMGAGRSVIDPFVLMLPAETERKGLG
jgi:hypothetical protein